MNPEEQEAFIAALRRKAEEVAAKDPEFADLRLLGKTLVDETRKRLAAGRNQVVLGAYLPPDGSEVFMLEPESIGAGDAESRIVSKLKELAQGNEIRAAAISSVLEREIPGGQLSKFIQVHREHVSGKCFTSGVPVDPLNGIPRGTRTRGRAIRWSG